jgi:chromosome segregation and condensation protein ScpB
MNTTAIKSSVKRPTAFRLNAELVERLKVLARKDNRSLNNYVEKVLMSVAYGEPNEVTKTALRDAIENKNLEEFDLESFKKFVDSL